MMEAITETNVVNVTGEMRAGKTTLVVAGCAMILSQPHQALLDPKHDTKLLVVASSIAEAEEIRTNVWATIEGVDPRPDIQVASPASLTESRIPTSYMAIVDGLGQQDTDEVLRRLEGLVSYVYVIR